MKKILSVILMLTFLMIPASGASAEEQKGITPLAMLGWENTWETYTEVNWEKSITDYSSEKVENTTSYSTTVRASTASEAVSIVEAGASAGVEYSGLKASVKADTKVTDKVTGEVTYEFKVTGTKVQSYTQYYDLYNQYIYYYYIYNLVDEYGNVHDVDYTGQFRYKSFTGTTKEVESRRSAY